MPSARSKFTGRTQRSPAGWDDGPTCLVPSMPRLALPAQRLSRPARGPPAGLCRRWRTVCRPGHNPAERNPADVPNQFERLELDVVEGTRRAWRGTYEARTLALGTLTSLQSMFVHPFAPTSNGSHLLNSGSDGTRSRHCRSHREWDLVESCALTLIRKLNECGMLNDQYIVAYLSSQPQWRPRYPHDAYRA
jgi:hypothetical protein